MTTVYQRDSRVESAPFESEAILFHPETKKFLKLNGTTSLIWDLLGSGVTAADVAQAICSTYRDVTEQEAIQDASAALEEMSRLGLVTKV